jgi:hypothetical protein
MATARKRWNYFPRDKLSRRTLIDLRAGRSRPHPENQVMIKGILQRNWFSGEPDATVSGRWAESPTITFNPMTGEVFIRSLIHPISPVNLISLIEAGWPIDEVCTIALRAINGLHASSHTALLKHPGDPEFYRVLSLLRELQESDALALRLIDEEDNEEHKENAQPDESSGKAILVLRNRQALDEEAQRASAEVRRLLHLNPETNQFSLAFGAVAKNDHEVALLTRSMMEILAEASGHVDIPASDMDEVLKMGSTIPSGTDKGLVIHVFSSNTKPISGVVFTSVHYQNHWFWIDNRDIPSKRGLGFLMALFTLLQSGTTAAPPVLTISKP